MPVSPRRDIAPPRPSSAILRPWRTEAGNFVVYNAPQEVLSDAPFHAARKHLIEPIPQETTTFRDAFVSKREIVNSENGIRFDSMARWYSRSAIYDERGDILSDFTRWSGSMAKKFDNPLTAPPERVRAAHRVTGRCLYLGTLHGHFGHFLLETLARAWAWPHMDEDVRPLFHFSNYARAVERNELDKIVYPEFILSVFDILGIDRLSLVLANRDLVVSELIVPSAQFWIADVGAPGMCAVYDHMREVVNRLVRTAPPTPKKIYLTRGKLNETQPHKIRKIVCNENEIEALFTSRGFESVALEQLPFAEQIRVIANASHIAGSTGSAMHMVLFNNRPDTQVISVDTRYSKSQHILEMARNIKRACHIFAYSGRNAQGAPMLDVSLAERALKEEL